MSQTTLAVPHYRKGIEPFKFDLARVYEAEARLSDIAIATKPIAKDLVATFTKAYVQLGKVYAKVKYEVAMAAIAARKRRAVILLDELPEKAKAKGLATARAPTGSEDVREAFFYTDEAYLAIEESRAALEATQELLFGKLMAMKAAMESCRAMLSPDDRPSFDTHGSALVSDPTGRAAADAMAKYGPEFTDPPTDRPEDAPPPITSGRKGGWGKPTYQE
jgi:hypothetical protein